MAMAARQESSETNGINVNQLTKTIDAIKQDPRKANAHFGARTIWKGGSQTETSIQSFAIGGKEETSRKQPFLLQGDEPAVLLGEDKAPSSVEAVLHALGSCLTVSFIDSAAMKGIQIDSLVFVLEGDLDLRGFLGIDKSVRPGYRSIRATCNVKADASQEQIAQLCKDAQERAPVMDMLVNPVNVEVQMG